MKTKQKSVLTTIGVAFVTYVIGAYFGFPFSQLGLTSGNIGRANKQSELVNSPYDVKLADRIETDTAYRNQMIEGFGLLYVQAQATSSTLNALKKATAGVNELKEFAQPLNNASEMAKQLSTQFVDCLKGLQDLTEGKPVNDMSIKLSQALNMFQILNANLSDLEAFNLKTEELAKQKKINDNLLKLYGEYLIESSDVAMSCGEKINTSQQLGSFLSQEQKASALHNANMQIQAAANNIKLNGISSKALDEMKKAINKKVKLNAFHDGDGLSAAGTIKSTDIVKGTPKVIHVLRLTDGLARSKSSIMNGTE